MGLVNQGRRDIQQAEFQREGIDLQKEKFEYQKTQDAFDNSMDMIAAGIDPSSVPGATGIIDSAAFEQAQQQSQQLKTVNSLQAVMDDSQVADPTGSGLDPAAMDNLVAQLAPSLNTNNREDFVLEHVSGAGGTRLITDEATYQAMVQKNPEMASWFTVKGAEPTDDAGQSELITRDTIGRLLGAEISSMPTSTSAGARAQAAAWEQYRNSPATSGVALAFETDKARASLQKNARTGRGDAQSTTRKLVDNDEYLMDNEKTDIIRQADQRSQRLINEAVAASEKATTPQEVAKIERKLRSQLNSVATDTANRAKRAKQDSKFSTALVGWTGNNTFNTDEAEGWGGGKHSTMRANAADAAKKTKLMISAHGRDKYLKEHGDTDVTDRDFDLKLTALETEMLEASKTGRRINADLYDFAKTYAPDVVTLLQDNNVPLFKEPEASSVVEETDLTGMLQQ
jgi:hypothetical protein